MGWSGKVLAPPGLGINPAVLLLAQDIGTPQDAATPTVLVIEDDDDFRAVICLSLRRAGFQIQSVHDAGSAWTVARDHPPIHAVLVDFRLPGIDGMSLARQLRRALPGVPVLAFTSWPEDLSGPTSPFDIVLVKPDMEPVIAALRRMTSRPT